MTDDEKAISILRMDVRLLKHQVAELENYNKWILRAIIILIAIAGTDLSLPDIIRFFV